ncbi:hypothetical protein SEA_ZOOMAN_222 [Microbacterium phage Zooman]|nr:hypothetical protein SEA_ZOOMAN_222 [Microbacterium phage Zooman]
MPKKNSLKIAPYLPYRRVTTKYDESLFPGYNYRDVGYEAAHAAWLASGVETVHFDGHTLMEYTVGKPGDQESAYGRDKIDWRDNEPFEATLTIRDLERGRSAARFWFEDEDNQIRYPFFGQTLVDMLAESTMINGKVTGTWIVVKKGSNYGIELYK